MLGSGIGEKQKLGKEEINSFLIQSEYKYQGGDAKISILPKIGKKVNCYIKFQAMELRG
jgi:hypothetical protein